MAVFLAVAANRSCVEFWSGLLTAAKEAVGASIQQNGAWRACRQGQAALLPGRRQMLPLVPCRACICSMRPALPTVCRVCLPGDGIWRLQMTRKRRGVMMHDQGIAEVLAKEPAT